MKMASDEWWKDLYDEHLADMLLVRSDPGEVKSTLSFLKGALGLRPGDRIFDQCCGIGSLAVPLAKEGFHVFGCDLVSGYVERAQAEAALQGVTIRLAVADAFDYVPPETCDAAINWWTSFGYARTDETNRRMLDRAWQALRPGGRFALDFMNVSGVLRGFQPVVVKTRQTAEGEITLTRHSQVDPVHFIMHKVWRYDFPNGRVVQHESRVRLYTPVELVSLLGEAGFVQVQLLGNIDGQPLTLDGLRCIALATKRRSPL